MRGAWIEIFFTIACLCALSMSLPMRGAWIEIMNGQFFLRPLMCRSPCGERGLKLTIVSFLDRHLMVAPHAGSVD